MALGVTNGITNYVKFLRGTPAGYEKLAIKDPNTLYFIANADEKFGKLYLGEKLISGSDGTIDLGEASLDDFKDVLLAENINEGDILIYKDGLWTNASLSEAVVSVMKGATEEADGIAGLVPAPKVGDINKFLRGDGLWAAPVAELSEADKETIKGLSSTIAVLLGDEEGSIKDIAVKALEEVLIPEDAKEALDTLQEIAGWIQNHPDDAAAMQSDISDLQTQVADINSLLNDKIVEEIDEETGETITTTIPGLISTVGLLNDKEVEKINEETGEIEKVVVPGLITTVGNLEDKVAENAINITNINNFIEDNLLWHEIEE